jgi:hypothetical protein
MIYLKILNTSEEEIQEVNEGSVSYPYSVETKLTLRNEGTYNALNVTVSIAKGITIQNYSTPAMIKEAKIEVPGYVFPLEYYDFITKEDYIIIDIANFPGYEKTIVIDQDGYSRNLIPGMAVSFNHLSKGANSGIFISEAYYMCGVAPDEEGVAGDFTNKVNFERIAIGEEVSFWYRFFLRKDAQAQRNPRVFNLTVTGVEDK